jgi:hypothetical protein
MTKITGKDLNNAYTKIQEQARKGLDKSLPAIIWIGNHQLEFMFDETVGIRGAWIMSSNIDVDFDEESNIGEFSENYYL